MKWNDYIKEKEDIQKRIAEESGYNLQKHGKMLDEVLKEVQEKFGDSGKLNRIKK